MYQGEIMIYTGIAMIVTGVILLLIVSIVFRIRKKKMIQNIYGEDEREK